MRAQQAAEQRALALQRDIGVAEQRALALQRDNETVTRERDDLKQRATKLQVGFV